MKKALLLLFLFPVLSFSQTDSLKKRKIGFQVSIPFEVGLSYFSTNTNSAVGPFDYLLNSEKSIGTRAQVFSLQLHFFDRVFIEYAYNLDNQGFQKNESINKFREQNSDYFIQEETANISEGNVSYGSYQTNYSRFGLGLNIYVKDHFYLKPYFCYAFGKASLPSGSYGFKELNSNRIFTREYSYEHVTCTGFHGGIALSKFMKSDGGLNGMLGFWGLKFEYSEMNVKGDGIITQSELFQSDITTIVPINKKFRYVTLGIFIGLSSSKDKRHL